MAYQDVQLWLFQLNLAASVVNIGQVHHGPEAYFDQTSVVNIGRVHHAAARPKTLGVWPRDPAAS